MNDISLWKVFKVGAVVSFAFSLLTGLGTSLVYALTGQAAPDSVWLIAAFMAGWLCRDTLGGRSHD